MKFTLNPHQKRLPFGGHHFHEDGMMIKGETVPEVAELLENYRIINGKPLGNPKQEIIDYYGVKFPWMVIKDLNPPEQEESQDDYIAWRYWVASVWGQPHRKFISRKEATMRLEVCKTCPHNVGKPWGDTRESTEFDRKVLLLRRGEKLDENVGFCALHKADIGVACFLESTSGLSRKDDNKPDHPGCWFSQFEGS